jgi:hypothetical protein
MPKSTQTSDWLTFEAVAEVGGQSIETLTESLQQDSPERAFRVLGFLFDRSRHKAGQPCLQLLEPPEEVEGDKPETDDLNPKPVADQPSNRTYNWDTMPLTVQIRWQPGTRRQVLISATTYDDFPLATLIPAADLGELPDAVQQLLNQLQQDLPIRALRHQQAQKKTKSKTPAKQVTKQPAPVAQTPASTSNQPTQFSIF